ncbi:MAG: hypothetical protein ACI8XO_001281 [Verrucomicrobiales bacterium]|jgi:hypothetical protein
MNLKKSSSLFNHLAPFAASSVLANPGFAAGPPAEAAAFLAVGEGLEASLYASEPMMLSPSSIDIDHLSRVWVC